MAVRYMYLRNSYGSKKSAPVGCLAIEKLPTINSTFDVKYAFSVANPKDVFSKKLAREIALGRLNTGTDSVANGKAHWIRLIPEGEYKRRDISVKVMHDIAFNKPAFPSRVQKAAVNWCLEQ